MRFCEITFNNYRCFLNDSIKFEENGEKNINLLIGPNGGGKTETLFAFWWVLYSLDFNTLNAKENAPYPLNIALYRNLENSDVDTEKSCSVTLKFEHENKTYQIKKTCDYRKTNTKIVSNEYRELSEYEENGCLTLPERDPDKIDKILSKILPKSILHGIIFDGERMQKLSAFGENSKNAISGVINDITNKELIEKCKIYFEEIKKSLNKNLKQLKGDPLSNNLAKIVDRIEELDRYISACESCIENDKQKINIANIRIKSITSDLKKIEEIKALVVKRDKIKVLIDEKNSNLDQKYKDFASSLREGYLLISETLFEKVEATIENLNVPADLTADAVRNILKLENCICGRCIDAEVKRRLLDLINDLPPDNINSSIREIIRLTRSKRDDTRNTIKKNRIEISEIENSISTLKSESATLTTQISSISDSLNSKDAQKIKELEEEHVNLKAEIKLCTDEINQKEKDLKAYISEKKEKIKQRDLLSTSQTQSESINKQLKFIEKSILALQKIEEINRNKALTRINQKLGDAYKLLSEDYALGRRIRVVQFDANRRSELVVYLEDKVIKTINAWKADGTYDKYLKELESEEAIKEIAILENCDPNSTGQSKMNTFAFVKAILDYANTGNNKDEFEICKIYPLIVDAPFSDISGKNLDLSSKHLHSFTNQIILMLDEDKYKALGNNLIPYVGKTYFFEKNKDKNYSTIKSID